MTAYKKDLALKVSTKIKDMPKEDISLAIDLIFDYLSEQLKKKNRIEIRGFGSFSLRDRAQHKMHLAKNQTKAESYKAVYFRGTKNAQNLP